MELLLTRIFPGIPFIEVADKWLESINRKSIMEQLRERKIHCVIYNNIKYHGILGTVGFRFTIQLNTSDTLKEMAKTLGHEIGHTFEPLDNFSSLHPPGNILQIEEFCEVFSVKWLGINGINKVQSFCGTLPFFAENPH